MSRRLGPLYVNGTGPMGQGRDEDIDDYNSPPAGQPGLWCQWTVSDDGHRLMWDGSEKFYRAREWLIYIVDNMLAPGSDGFLDGRLHEDIRLGAFTCNHSLNGRIIARGEEETDVWGLLVENNNVMRIDP